MPNIVHRIGVENSSPDKLYSAIATQEGLSSWWTESVIGEPRVGSVLQFRFSKGGPDFEVLELTPPNRVRWKCVAGPEEWIDTHIHFDVKVEGGETALYFKHCGWREEVPFMHHCSTQWAYFLIGLKAHLEEDQGTPYGSRFKPISRWSR
ncbi:MAG: hypothetical protein QOF89_5559 [Acidobacteriota bacterium]|jgi:hypothetical protein|nr:hypothetical protein [Acidobacteriota bacterium]